MKLEQDKFDPNPPLVNTCVNTHLGYSYETTKMVLDILYKEVEKLDRNQIETIASLLSQ